MAFREIPRALIFKRLLGVFLALVFASFVYAQDQTVAFSTTDSGRAASITNWGLDTCWPSFDNMQRGLIYMGTNNVTIVRVGFFVDAPLTNNDITPADRTNLQTDVNLAAMATEAKLRDLNLDSSVNAWYQSGTNLVYPNRWAAAMEACQRYYGGNFWSAEGFNEPDYAVNNEGSAANLDEVFNDLRASTNFPGTYLAGGSTLDDDLALSWFDGIAGVASIGTTHCLAGSASSYVNFLQSVAASNALPFNPEVHNLCETIIGANYGLEGAIWWGTAERARGSFVNACQGRRLGYAENDDNWTAAAVYRGTNGFVQAFLGGSERMAVTTTYRFFAMDRDVFYDGYGPRRDYPVTVPGGNGYQVDQPDMEQVVNITWGADVQPPIGGRYIVVNHHSGLVLEVPGADTNNGALLGQNIWTNGANQLWDVYPLTNNSGGDVSYFTIAAAHDGVTADLVSSSAYDDGDPVQQWNGGTNVWEQWYFQYVTNGYFKIRSRWSTKVVGVNGSSASPGAGIVQWDDTGTLDQQWRLIPATVTNFDFVAPAQPIGLAATANAASVRLTWQTNSEADLASYTVLRSTTNGGPYCIVARGLTNNAFTDKSANQPVMDYYVVQAVDRSLNTSVYSQQVSAEPTGSPALIAEYTFDGNLADSSGNANNPIVTNGSPALVAGIYGSALGLNGTNQSLMLPAGLMAVATNFTIAAWVYWNGGAAWQRIFDFGNDTTQYLFLTPSSGSGTLRFAISTNGNGAEQRVETAALVSNQWVHVAFTCAAGTGCLYTNGVLAASGSVSLNPANFNPALNYLGESQFSADPFFNGALDQVLVANYAMSAAQIAWLPIGSAPLPVLAHRYSFHETNGSATVADSVGGAAWNGTLPNGGVLTNGQLSFSSAKQQYLNLPGGILSSYAAITIDLWISSISGAASSPPYVYLFAFGDTDESGNGCDYLFFNPNLSRAAISAADPGFDGEQGGNLASSLGLATNLHLTCVFDPPAGVISIYTNGVLASTFAGITDPLGAVGGQFAYVGRSLYTADAYLTWTIRELRLYDGAMSAADVAGSQIAGPDLLLTTNVSLNTLNTGAGLTMSWPVAASGFMLASSPVLGRHSVWAPVAVKPSVIGTDYRLAVDPTNTTLFFRLQR